MKKMSQHSPYIQRLRKAGYKRTQARLTVLDILEAEHGHITSSDILAKVNEINPSIGRASIFRTLDLFTQLGIIRPTYISTSLTPTYVMMHEGHHHHVICTHCNHVMEFDDCGLEMLTQTLEKTLNVKISGHLLEFYGVCASCVSDSA
jgi:Fur family transcriptional regulator, ferric uptake regulator